jgi:DNA processing protein
MQSIELPQTALLTKEEEIYWLALTLVPGLGTRTANKLLDCFRTPQAIFRSTRTELETAGVSGAVAQSIASGCTFDDDATQQQKMMEAGAVAITIGDPRCPQALREIFDLPVLLFARGRIELLHSISLGVVGTRPPTPYALAVAERLSADLAHAGMAITSGMARGIDAAAHQGALAAGGDTIAVFG